MHYVITILFDLNQYRDRFYQLVSSLPENCKLVIVTKNKSDLEIDNNLVEVIMLQNNIFNKSFFLKFKLLLIVNKYAKFGKVVIIDWFMTFNYVQLLRHILRKNIKYVYAPVISNYGWLYKRVTGQVPSVGLRYDYIRYRDALQDYLTVKLCDLLMVQSKDLMSFYSKSYNIELSKIRYNYNAFHPLETHHSSIYDKKLTEKIKLGFVGNIDVLKGICEMYEVMCQIDADKFELHLAGKASGKKSKKIFKQMLKLPNIIYRGYLNKDKLFDFYNEIDALMLLSYHEGSPRVIREFIDYQKPIFLYDNPGVDYSKGMEGVYMYKYGETIKIVNDVQNIEYDKKYKRVIPKYVEESNIINIIEELF